MVPAAVALAGVLTGCASSQDRTSHGSLSVRLAASRPFVASDPLPQLAAAKVTISEIEARRSDGSWVPSETEPPDEFDLVALDASGVTLAGHLLPDGQYSALQIRFGKVELTLKDGTRVPLPAPPTGWAVMIPADFSLASDRATVVGLNVRTATSFKFGGGHFEFEPEVDLDGALRDEHVLTPTTARDVSRTGPEASRSATRR